MAEELARFIDRYTLEYVRTYPHPIDRVWRAIIEPAEFSAWFIPGRMEARVGGRYWFGDDGFQGAVQALEPPTLLRLADDKQGQVFQYVLSAVGGDNTRMQFVHCYPRDGVPQVEAWTERFTDEQRRALGGVDRSSYPQWRPGAMGGFHAMFDALADHLDGVEKGSRLPATTISTFVHGWATLAGGMNDFAPEEKARRAEVFRSLRDRERWMELIDLYRDLIAATLPPPRG